MRSLRLLFGFFALTSCLISTAQAPFDWHCNPNFGDGYPMITFTVPWLIDPIQPKDGSESIEFELGDFIKTINGKDVLTENGFDELNKTGFIDVQYFSWPDQELKTFVFHNDLFNYGEGGGDMRKPQTLNFVPLFESVLPEVSLVKSSNVNFTDFRTYDFLIEGDDPLVDEELLNTFMKAGFITKKMKRDVDNPDVIFRIAKNTDQTFSTTYVPPTQQVVGTSTTIKPVYNYLTRTTSYKADQRVQTIQKEGHTEVTNVDNIFLEVVALDAKKLNDPNQKTPPEIWKLTYSSREVNDNRSDIKRYKDILEACEYPFTKPYRYMIALPLLTGATLVPSDDNKTLKVDEVGINTPADFLGLEAGDIILKINGKNEIKRIEKDRRGFTLKEHNIPLGKLPYHLNQAAYYIIVTELHPTEFHYPLKHTTFKKLNKEKDNEFLIERNGKKIKLKGQLWPKEVYDMDTDGFRKWCLNNKVLPIIRYPE